jgi:hypothetical protein
MGLKLESGKVPVDLIVIERSERPSADYWPEVRCSLGVDGGNCDP